MSIHEHTTPEKLTYYSFLWSEVRLVVAAVALFLGGIPPVLYFSSFISPFYGLISSLLTLCWIISGIASAYLLYQWVQAGKTVFGGTEAKDVVAFFVSVVSGLNLGVAGLLGTNVGMRISSSHIIFIIVGLLYVWSAWYLYHRWNEKGQELF